MNPLSMEEKERIAHLAAYSATNGGRFFIGLALLLLVVVLLAVAGTIPLDTTIDATSIGPFITLELFLVGLGGWLLSRKKSIRQQLDQPLQSGTAVVTKRVGPTETGWHLTLQIETPHGQQTKGRLVLLGNPPWHEGEKLELYFLADGKHFFPKELQHPSDFGRIRRVKERSR